MVTNLKCLIKYF